MADDPYAGLGVSLVSQDPYAGLGVSIVGSQQPADANPFNRTLGADVSYGSPLQAPTPVPPVDLSGEARAGMGGPITDRAVSAFQTYAPAILGGTGQDYSLNLSQNRQDTAAAQSAHPADAMAGNVASYAPLALAAPAVAGALSNPLAAALAKPAVGAAIGYHHDGIPGALEGAGAGYMLGGVPLAKALRLFR